MEKIKTVLIGITIILFTGCANEQPVNKQVLKKESFKSKKDTSNYKSSSLKTKDFEVLNQDGILKIRDKNKEYILTAQGLDYDVHISDDKQVLVVDVLRMSNLKTVKIFTKKDTKKFRKSNKNISKVLWQRYLKGKSYTFKDIKDPQLQFRDWVDNDTFEVELWGEVNDKIIKDILRYDIR